MQLFVHNMLSKSFKVGYDLPFLGRLDEPPPEEWLCSHYEVSRYVRHLGLLRVLSIFKKSEHFYEKTFQAERFIYIDYLNAHISIELNLKGYIQIM